MSEFYIYLTNAEEVCNDNSPRFFITPYKNSVKGWVFLLATHLDLPPREQLLEAALTQIAEDSANTRAEFQIQLDALDERREKLLALTHLPETSND